MDRARLGSQFAAWRPALSGDGQIALSDRGNRPIVKNRSYATITSMKAPTILLLLFPSLLLAADQSFSIDATDQSITIKSNHHEVLVYQLEKPDNPKYPLESACFFHPLRSPSGKILTDFANADHPHHRGIFLGWVEMHGRKDADFW